MLKQQGDAVNIGIEAPPHWPIKRPEAKCQEPKLVNHRCPICFRDSKVPAHQPTHCAVCNSGCTKPNHGLTATTFQESIKLY